MKRKYKWLNEFLDHLYSLKIISDEANNIQKLQYLNALNKYPILQVDAKYFGQIAHEASIRKYRFQGVWAKDLNSQETRAGLIGKLWRN